MAQNSTRLPTPNECDTYRRDGAVLLRGILSPDWIDVIRTGLDESYSAPGALSSKLAMPDGKGEIRMDQMPSLANARLMSVVTDSPAAAIAGALLDTGSVHHVLDQMFFKPSGTILPTAWHQDTPYLRVKGDNLCRLWMSCDPSPAKVTVNVVRGSHLWGVEFRPVEAEDVDAVEEELGDGFSYKAARFDQSLPKVPRIAEHQDSFDILSWDVEPGDILAFNGNILHGSSHTVPNHPISRRALAILWGAGDVASIHRPGHAVPDIALARGLEAPDGTPIRDHPDMYPAYRVA